MQKDIFQCIVKNEKYEAASFKERAPDNTVLTQLNPKHKIYKYKLSNGVFAEIKRTPNKGFEGSRLLFYYNDLLIEKLIETNFQSFADHLNMYSQFNDVELKKLQIEVQETTLFQLEQDIDNLQIQKDALEEDLEVLLEIKKKAKEIKKLSKKISK
ncbi:hypothetical protein [Algibacter sp. L4_22]|uniref:hypothetical protein n=1 Tax=Algibacter sp. L4_22 TaxID=2942477 RepID=UPI00201B87F3|nr:hypothetical protein [Algibacter sp. L4_22]MCL5127308.1 hypothetical protein [Algibacter sp. L4_22]